MEQPAAPATPTAAGSVASTPTGNSTGPKAAAEPATSDSDDPFDCFRRGHAQLRAGDLAAAEASFRDAIARNPDVASFHLALGDCLARSQRLDDAIAAIGQAVRLAPDDPAPHALLGDMLLRAGRFADSEAALRRSLALRDHAIGPLHLLSIAIDRQGRYAEAAAVADRLAALAPDNPDYVARHGALCALAGDYPNMERAYRAAIALRPGNLAFHQSLIVALDRQGREDALLQALRAAREVGPDDAGLADQFGTLMMTRERWAEAEQAFRAATLTRQHDFGLFHKLGIVLERQQKFAEAVAAAEQASLLAPNDDNLAYRVAVLSLNARHDASAERALRRVMQLRPAAATLHHMLGVALERQGRLTEAIDEARAALALDPNDRALQGRVVALRCKSSRGMPAAPKTYLVFTATSVGLGHLMAAVLGSAYYAWETGRVFCMDMRRVLYFSDDPHKAFFEHFELVVPEGLEVITDLSVIETIRQEPDLHFLTLATPLDIERPFPNKVVLVPCITPGDPFGPRVRRADEPFRIELKGPLAEAMSRCLARPEWQRQVIGIHYRAAVGEMFDRMSRGMVPDYDERYAVVKDNYVAQAMRLIEGKDAATYAFFVASDDRAFVAEMLSRLPNAFAFDSLRPDIEIAAYVNANKRDLAILVDAVMDLWALSRCQQLIYSFSAFTHFAIMNSAHLDDRTTFYIHVPMFQEILDTLPPETAVAWARAVVRKIDLRRMLFAKMHDVLARSLQRAGRDDEAALFAKRARWLHQAAHASEIANLQAFAEQGTHDGGMTDPAQQRLRRAIASMPDNPYFLGGYDSSLSTLLRRQGDMPAAIAVAREAVALDPLDAFLHNHLGGLLAMSGHVEAAEASFRTALELAPDVAVFHANASACAEQRGDMQYALAAARRAAELDPDNDRLRKRSEALASARNLMPLVR